MTHIVVDECHLWGDKRVAIPITAVGNIDDGIQVALTEDEVRDLSAVERDPSLVPGASRDGEV